MQKLSFDTNDFPLNGNDVMNFILSNSSVSHETRITRGKREIDVKAFHIEAGDFTFEVMARQSKLGTGQWFVHSVEIVAGEVKG